MRRFCVSRPQCSQLNGLDHLVNVYYSILYVLSPRLSPAPSAVRSTTSGNSAQHTPIRRPRGADLTEDLGGRSLRLLLLQFPVPWQQLGDAPGRMVLPTKSCFSVTKCTSGARSSPRGLPSTKTELRRKDPDRKLAAR